MIAITKIYYFLFAVLTIGGGVMGYVKAGSMPSLIAGGVSGALLLVSALLIPSKLHAGLIVGLVVSLLLAARFAPIFLAGKKMMPAGMMTILSVVAIILTIVAWIKK
jgi:uncharacterized membrane protein (UPF0136 family)